ncbi:MAG TPA: sugar MFS transporter [Bacteroidales bacterium]|nr:sugar MFS transporter [Bacteroidales bacterium]
MTALFFMWGFITCMNDILIPFLKKVFDLNYFQAMLVQLAFFGAYFIGSLIYFIISATLGDPIYKIGYKRSIIIGLLLSALGCAMFYPAASYKIYELFLVALFILALGFTMLQIAANPYIAILGPPEGASSRLNLAQGFNSFGTTIAPIVGGYFVFHFFATYGKPLLDRYGEVVKSDLGQTLTAFSVQVPYLFFTGIFLVLALVIGLIKLPALTGDHEMEISAGALRYRNLVLGFVAIFMYVGAEVSIGSLFINFANELLHYPEMTAKSFLAFYWGGAMIGRFLGAISLSGNTSDSRKLTGMILTSVVGFFLIYFIVYLESAEGFPITYVLPFVGFLLLNFFAFRLGRSMPARTLLIFAMVNIVMLVSAMAFTGKFALWFIIGIGLFNSIMWSNIFTLAIKGLGKYTSQASSILIMGILGGAVLPLLQGSIADRLGGIHYSFFIPVLAYAYLAYYGWKGHIPKKMW